MLGILLFIGVRVSDFKNMSLVFPRSPPFFDCRASVVEGTTPLPRVATYLL
jgi:hypothetical protein